MQPVTVLSFGYLHPATPDLAAVDVTLDLRRLLADPAHIPDGDMLDMDGREPAVRNFVFRTPGALDLLDHAFGLTRAVAAVKPITVALGCAGGRHRSVVLAEALHARLLSAGLDVVLRHLHVHLPRVIK
jgi:RNase adaptor protein for sRNA GlmZ degradation